MLQTGKIPDALAQKGFRFTRPPKFFEARAMIHENVCMNRVEGIAYPTFTIQTSVAVPSPTEAPEGVTQGYSAPIGREIGTVSEISVGGAVGFEQIKKWLPEDNGGGGGGGTAPGGTTVPGAGGSTGSTGSGVGGT